MDANERVGTLKEYPIPRRDRSGRQGKISGRNVQERPRGGPRSVFLRPQSSARDHARSIQDLRAPRAQFGGKGSPRPRAALVLHFALESTGHHRGGPVRGLCGRVFQSETNDPFRSIGPERRDARWPGLVAQKPLDAFLHEALLPAPDAGLGLGRSPHDLDRAGAIGAEQNNLGTPDMLLGRVPITQKRLQTAAVGERNFKGNTCAHATDSHTQSLVGIPNRTLVSGGNH